MKNESARSKSARAAREPVEEEATLNRLRLLFKFLKIYSRPLL